MDNVAVYGSLLKGLCNHRLFEEHNAEFVGKGTIQGFTMYSLIGFPGIRHSDDLDETVVVEVYRVDEAGLSRLDRLEGYDERNPKSSFYVREEVDALMDDGSTLRTLVYVFNRPLDDREVVSSGDWRTFVEERARGRQAQIEENEEETGEGIWCTWCGEEIDVLELQDQIANKPIPWSSNNTSDVLNTIVESLLSKELSMDEEEERLWREAQDRLKALDDFYIRRREADNPVDEEAICNAG